MPDLPVDPSGPGRYPGDMESRVAVLEQIARTTTEGLAQIVRGMEAQRAEFRTLEDRLGRRIDLLAADQRVLAAEHRADFRWLLGSMLGGFSAMLGLMAHGFHWL